VTPAFHRSCHARYRRKVTTVRLGSCEMPRGVKCHAPQGIQSHQEGNQRRHPKSSRVSSETAIAGAAFNQRPSRGHQKGRMRGHHTCDIQYPSCTSSSRRPEPISGNQWQSVAISVNQCQSVAISGNQWHSPATSNTPAARRRRCGPIPAPHTPSPSPRSGPWPVPRRARRAGCPRRRAPPRCSSASADLWQRRQAQYTGRAGWCARPSRSSCASPFCGACVRRLPRGQRVQSDTIRRHQTPLGAIRRHQASSGVIWRTHLPRAQSRST
jgi:hypothetical protein